MNEQRSEEVELMRRLRWEAREGLDLSPPDPLAVFALEKIDRLECGIKGCVLPKYHHGLPDSHPHRWCSITWVKT